jgi:hypothetical protein
MVDWIYLLQFREQRRAVVYMALNFRYPQKVLIFLHGTLLFSRSNLAVKELTLLLPTR